SVDVQTGKLGLSKKYLPWWRGDSNLFSVQGGREVSMEMSAKYNREDAITQAMWKSKDASRLITNLSLLELPIDTQLMFNIVLMIPIGALVIVMLRQLIGIPTFGTFMPVLMALSFRETGLFWGIGLFTLVVMIGLFLRAYFDELRLLVVPRLAAVLTIVVMLIAALTVISYRFGINAGLSITLFPMIILTMTIERMALMTEEFGAKTARRTAFGSVVAASLAYLCMHNALMEHLIFLFPELLLIVLACCILLGRYNGYKLSEYFRFKKLAKAMQDNVPPPVLPAE
ncbi:MAG TPA: 7TM domain-containing protein, partial [Alphaproteobacteria bacterium]